MAAAELQGEMRRLQAMVSELNQRVEAVQAAETEETAEATPPGPGCAQNDSSAGLEESLVAGSGGGTTSNPMAGSFGSMGLIARWSARTMPGLRLLRREAPTNWQVKSPFARAVNPTFQHLSRVSCSDAVSCQP